MTVNLDVLRQHRNDLLLAEVAALLHDMGKFCNLHIESHTKGGQKKWPNQHAYKVVIDAPKSVINLSKAAASLKKPDALNNVLNAQSPKAADFISPDLKDFLQNKTVNLFAESYSLGELIMLGTPGFATDKNRNQLLDGKSGWLAAVLGVCHNEAHVDKEDPPSGQGEQTWPNVFISTAFGYEGKKVVVDTSPESLDSRLRNLPVPPARDKLLEELSFGLGDTRRPVNEVVLSDWGWMVASLFKPAIAVALLTNQQPGIRQWKSWRDKIIDHDLRWRLLRVNFDVLGLYAKAVKIGDLLGYQRVVNEACEAVKKLIEEEYPLGNEIYRDSTGIYFTFPDLDLPADLAQEIRRRVEAVEMELAPLIAVTVGDGSTAAEQLKGILGKSRQEALEALEQPFHSQNLSAYWQQQWTTVGRGKRELCLVCRLRPKREDRDVCQACEKRRTNRVKQWLGQLEQTIWLDEVADLNGRVALIVGKFGLDDWLSGDLVQTMLVKVEEKNPQGCIPKNPSPARLRRIWETTRTFWQEVLPTDPGRNLANSLVAQKVGQSGPRLEIIPESRNTLSLGAFHTYELVVNNIHLSVVWDDTNQRFITCDNLDYLAKPEQLGRPVRDALVAQKGTKLTLEEPVGYGAKNKVLGTITIVDVQELPDRYVPAIPILAEPRTFMALVPADKALEVVKAIKEKYEREMGKVRNRLPLTLGVVYFGRRTPLAAALDAGRRMLRRPTREVIAYVQSIKPDSTDNNWPTERQLTLHLCGREITLSVPTLMGDGQTRDLWYPYWQVKCKPTNRTRWFIGPDGEHWVHVCDLRKGDQVAFTPSTFDYEFLDTTTRRFEVSYDASGQRRGKDKRQRPYLLEQLDELEQVWKDLSRLSKSQIYAVLSTIEAKREMWQKPSGAEALALPNADAFRQFVRDTLSEAAVYSDSLERAALSGALRDALEIHLGIMKKEFKQEEPK